MATIECCECLSSSTKAKLQDAGILHLTDLARLLKGEQSTGDDRKLAQMIEGLSKRVAQCASAHADAASDAPNTCGKADAPRFKASEPDTIAITPIDNISFFTESEVDEIYEAMRSISTSTKSPSDDLGAGGDLNISPSSPSQPTRSAGKTMTSIPGCCSLRDILNATRWQQRNGGQATHATTFSRALDTLLGGGVPVGGVTEVSGPPGVGKTQLLMQLAVSCVMPVEFGGLGGSCLFVDTEGSFVAERLEQMATAAVALVTTILAKNRATELRGTDTAKSTTLDGSVVSACRSSARKRARSVSSDSAVAESAKEQANNYAHSESADDNEGASDEDGLPADNSNEADTHRNLLKDEPRITSCRKASCLSSASFTVELVLQRVHYVRITELTEFLAFLYSLPLWLDSEKTSEVTHGTHCDEAHAPLQPAKDRSNGRAGSDQAGPLRMVLIDSVALPFRDSDAFEKNASTNNDMFSIRSHPPDAIPLPGKPSAFGALSKHGLWQRSRLLYQCSTALASLASTYHLAVVVSNHMTTKLLCTATGNGRGSWAASSSDMDRCGGDSRQSVLVPALGDAWSHGPSTRMLLAFHHYELPSCAFVTGNTAATKTCEMPCLEDVVYSTASTTGSSTAPTPPNRVVQHRVARLLKAAGRPRAETCFLITSKGIRDVRRDMVQSWLAPPSAAQH